MLNRDARQKHSGMTAEQLRDFLVSYCLTIFTTGTKQDRHGAQRARLALPAQWSCNQTGTRLGTWQGV